MACEKLAGIEVPRRGEYCRVIAVELNRIASHLLSVGTMGMDIGAFTPFTHALREREHINNLMEELCGARLTFSYMRIGGVAYDLPPGWVAKAKHFLDRFEPLIEEYNDLISFNKIYVERLINVAVISAADAIDYNLTGPNLRGSGVKFDVRKDLPYSIYPELEFDVPTRTEGDCLARYLLRMEEIKQSIRIIDQCLENMPDGPIMAKLPRLIRPRPGRAWSGVEGPRGVYGAYAISDGTDQPFRLKIHDPSFIHLQAVGALLPGHLLADTMAIMASLDPVMGGVDK